MPRHDPIPRPGAAVAPATARSPAIVFYGLCRQLLAARARHPGEIARREDEAITVMFMITEVAGALGIAPIALVEQQLAGAGISIGPGEQLVMEGLLSWHDAARLIARRQQLKMAGGQA